VQAPHHTFPSPGGDGHSLDCFPDNGKNVSGSGLDIRLAPSTSGDSLPSGVDCGFPPFTMELCHCGICGANTAAPCKSNADCLVDTCVSAGQGKPLPNQCGGSAVCDDSGDGSGTCAEGPIDKFCDLIVRANGEGFISCLGNLDCEPESIGLDAGSCTLSSDRGCFAPTILAQGTVDPVSPTLQSIFCIPPTASAGINTVAGLPGPGRVLNQIATQAYCDVAKTTPYQPGVGGCP
jgi:hypothetical protein